MRVSILTKLLAAFGVMVCLLLVVGLFGIARIGSDHAQLDQLAQKVIPNTLAVGEISALMNKYRKDQLQYIVAKAAERQAGVPGSISSDLTDDLSSMRERLRSVRKLIVERGDMHLVDDFQATFGRYVQLTSSFRGLADSGRHLQAGIVVGQGGGNREYDRLKALIADWNAEIVEDAQLATASSYSSYDLGMKLLVGMLAASVAIAITVAIYLARRTTRAVRRVGAAAKAIAEGDIEQHVEAGSRDELGDMARDFDLMIRYLTSTAAVAETIASGDLSVEVKPRSERDVLGNSLATMTQSLRGLMRDKESLIEQIPAVVMAYDAYGDGSRKFAYVSRQSATILGIEPATFLADAHRFMEHVHADDQDLVRAAIREPAAAGRNPRPAEFRFVRPDGREVWLREVAALVYGDHGLHRVQAVLFDITGEKETELERERLQLDLRLAQKLEAVGQLAAGVAHEINTPIQFIGDSVAFLNEAVDELLTLTGVYHELLHTEEAIDRLERRRRADQAEQESDLEYLTERVPPAFERALSGIERVASIVRALRQFAHPSTDRTPVDINEAIRTTLIVATNEYKYVADIKLDLQELPLVTASAGDLNQVFLNLVVNAAHAIGSCVQGSDQRGTITVQTRAQPAGVVITITDTGCGIPQEIAGRIFDPFFTTKPVGQGTGQGLAIAHTIIVERHHGTINFEPAAGGGTTFRIFLPSHQALAERDAIRQAA